MALILGLQGQVSCGSFLEFQLFFIALFTLGHISHDNLMRHHGKPLG